MLLILFKKNKQQQQITTPPFLMPILPITLNSRTSQLFQPIYQYFKQYLSPFITTQNLKLIINSNPVNPQYPLYFYFNYHQYIQQCICTIGPSQNSINRSERKTNVNRNSILIAIYQQQSQNPQKIINMNQNQCIPKLKNIIPKQRLKQIDNIVNSQIIKSVIINNKKILVKEEFKLSDVLSQYWEKYEFPNNSCVYVRINK